MTMQPVAFDSIQSRLNETGGADADALVALYYEEYMAARRASNGADRDQAEADEESSTVAVR